MDRRAARGRRLRLRRLMVAGIVDSLCLSAAWTVLMLQVVATYGLGVAGLCSAAMLVGIAVSAPAAGRLSRWFDGRGVLLSAGACEAVLRCTVFALVFGHAPVWALMACVGAMNVTAWTGYAAMRAEVAAVSDGAAALTWYGTMVAAVEAGAVALAALLPIHDATLADPVVLGVLTAYLLSLVPTAVAALGSRVSRAAPAGTYGPRGRARPAWRHGVLSPVYAGAALMFLGSAPTLLSVALAAELFGRWSVAPAAVAFTAGSLLAPTVVARLPRRVVADPRVWTLFALGIVGGWALAPVDVLFLCLAQVLSGLCMTALEGILDVTAARSHPRQVTAAIARATSGRALGSAAGTVVLPVLVAVLGLGTSVLWLVGLLLVTLVALSARPRPTGRHLADAPRAVPRREGVAAGT